MNKLNSRRLLSRRAMTLMEILIVVSLIAMMSVAIFNALSNGMKIWKRSQQMVIEEDIAVFFDKIAHDIRNAFVFSQFRFEGDELRFAFPTMVYLFFTRLTREAILLWLIPIMLFLYRKGPI